MIVKLPSNKYEKELYSILDEQYNLTGGEKSIIYDLCISTIKYSNKNWNNIDVITLIDNVITAYKKSPNINQGRVICNCINKCFIDITSDYVDNQIILINKKEK